MLGQTRIYGASEGGCPRRDGRYSWDHRIQMTALITASVDSATSRVWTSRCNCRRPSRTLDQYISTDQLMVGPTLRRLSLDPRPAIYRNSRFSAAESAGFSFSQQCFVLTTMARKTWDTMLAYERALPDTGWFLRATR